VGADSCRVAFYFDGVGRRELKTAGFYQNTSKEKLLSVNSKRRKGFGYGVRSTLFPDAYHSITGHAGSGLGTCRHENMAL
jgi:hypothetical protein